MLGAVERFLEGRHITHVILRVRRQGAAELVSGQGGRFGATGGEHRGHAEFRGFELLRGEGRLAEDLAEQLERLRKRVPFGFDGEGQLPGGTAAAAAAATAATPAAAAAATRSDADAQRIELLAEGLAIVFLRAGHHQAGEHSGRGRLVLE